MTAQQQDTQPAFTLIAEPLTAEAFAPYGDVVEVGGEAIPINQGKGWRYLNLATLEVTADGGQAALSLITADPEELPVSLRLMERHPLGSQMFYPTNGQDYIVAVAPAGEPPAPEDIKVFLASGSQGINYRQGVWHHPMIALEKHCTFVEVHRRGPGMNCDETAIAASIKVALS